MPQTIYFGYGSNLWLRQMRLRCPDSIYLGLGRLQGWRLQINERGYCNVVQQQEQASKKHIWEVYGVVYSLSSTDEERLDINEGVPTAYTKEVMPVEFWPASEKQDSVDISAASVLQEMLLYVDRNRTVDSQPQKEYILRMNRGIEDALKLGVPSRYVDEVVRSFIPIGGDEILSHKDKEDAERQAREFKD